MAKGLPERRDVRAVYGEALRRYLANPDEAALAEGYRLGREALDLGYGLLDWAQLHEDTLAELPNCDRRVLTVAGAFFRETLSAFEMTQRGYAENNRWLEKLNRELRREIAEKERLSEELQQTNRELQAFSYSVAHDLRAPLRRISAFNKIVASEYAAALDPTAREYLDRIDRNVERTMELIDGLLFLAKIIREQLERQPIDLAEMARSIVVQLREFEPEREVDVVISPSIPANGDSRLVRAALENLIGNAWKFTGKRAQARIEVGVDAGASPPVYFVRDNGAGFDMKHAEKLFGAFQRLHTSEAFPGTGIGLATVQRIITRHGGRIWADATVEGGATFHFTLPPLPEH